MKIQLEIDLKITEALIDVTDKDEVDWLLNTILTSTNIYLHDNEIGDIIGEVDRLKVLNSMEIRSKIKP